MEKKLRFYSKEENAILNQIAKSDVALNKTTLGEFCTKYNRNINSVMTKIYNMRQNTRKFVKKETKTTLSDKTVMNLSKGQFRVPISNWTISNENGQFYFIAKF